MKAGAAGSPTARGAAFTAIRDGGTEARAPARHPGHGVVDYGDLPIAASLGQHRSRGMSGWRGLGVSRCPGGTLSI